MDAPVPKWITSTEREIQITIEDGLDAPLVLPSEPVHEIEARRVADFWEMRATGLEAIVPPPVFLR